MPIIQENELRKGTTKKIYWGIIVFLVILIPVQLLPHAWMFFGMFKAPLEVISFPPKLFPEKFLWNNITETFRAFKLWNNIKNTFLLCVGTIMVQVPISALGAFALSKLRLRGSSALLLFFVGTMMISNQATIIPTYLMMFDFPLTHWNLVNSLWSVILTFSAWGWAVFLFKNFFDSLPPALFEAARIDGAGNMTIFLKIVVPLSMPVFSIAVLNTFNAVYSQFMVPLMLLPKKEKWPLMVQIYQSTMAAVPWNQVMVLLSVASIPLILIYVFCQRYIVEGIVMTGIKG
jgi:multiple sugar transport system permease protein